MLDLSRNEIGDEGAKQLGAALKQNEVNCIIYSSISSLSALFYTEPQTTPPSQESNSRQWSNHLATALEGDKTVKYSFYLSFSFISVLLYTETQGTSYWLESNPR
jgi:hypothetical protein